MLAAQEVFSTRDYTQARVSDIAAEAGINQALVVRYFGTKHQLFETALAALLEENSVDGLRSRANFGRQIVRRLLGEDGSKRDPLPMVIHAVSDPVAQPIAQRLMATRILQPLARWLGGDAAEARAAELLLLCAGLFTYRKLLPLPPFEGSMAPPAREWLEERLQALVDEPYAPQGK
ncbi:MAG: TetR family transcriptional regulator [Sphingomonadaceae bacterium]|nr:TetR family transcriptional regulator [Sphingomonadaceae bacterium]